MSVNLIGYERIALTEFMAELGEPSYRADQILKWIHQRGETRFDAMTDLSKPLRSRLNELANIEGLKVASEILSSDGTAQVASGTYGRQLCGNCIHTGRNKRNSLHFFSGRLFIDLFVLCNRSPRLQQKPDHGRNHLPGLVCTQRT